MIRKPSLLLRGGVLTLVLLTACGQDASNLLVGQWKAIAVTENGQDLALDPARVRFEFSPDGRYRYQSTLDYREAGYYRVVNDYLLSRDTLTPQTKEKAVRIALNPTADTLTVDMEYLGRSQQLVLVPDTTGFND